MKDIKSHRYIFNLNLINNTVKYCMNNPQYKTYTLKELEEENFIYNKYKIEDALTVYKGLEIIMNLFIIQYGIFLIIHLINYLK